jgi:hypothetical protein
MDTSILKNLQTLSEGDGIIPTVTPVQQGLIVADICSRAKEEIERLQALVDTTNIH